MVTFSRDYSTFSLTQQYQHAKLFKIMKKELGEYTPQKVLDIGCGDGKQTLFIAKQYPYARVIGIDISESLLREAERMKKSVGVKNVEFHLVDYFDFREADFDVIVSNNVFHWFGRRTREGYRKLAYHLAFGGYFFIHQGGRWSYIALRRLMEEMLQERGITPPPYSLFYPTKKGMDNLLTELGFSYFQVRKEIEHEIESRQVYIDFTYAGGLPYINALPEEERERFRVEFVRRCIEEECPAFPVRLYIWGRNTIPFPSIEYTKGNVLLLYRERIADLLKEVDTEFVPPLSARRSSTDMNLEIPSGEDITPYLNSLMKQNFILAVESSGRITGLLSYIKDFSFEGKRWVYVSTIAVRKVARGLGLGTRLYKELFSLFPDAPILTRTWTGNDTHLNLLRKLGFKEIKRLPDHRGKGIDTIYMGRW